MGWLNFYNICTHHILSFEYYDLLYLYGSDVYEGTAPLWLNPPLLLLPPPVMPEPSRAGSPESQPLPGPTLSPFAPSPPTPVGLVKNTLKRGKAKVYHLEMYII